MKRICRLLIVVSVLINVASAVAAQTVSVTPASVESPAVGRQFTVSLKITNGANVAGYQATVVFDTSALRYVESATGDYLPAGAFFVPPSVSGNQVTLAATSFTGESNGAGTLATVTFEVIAVKASTLRLTEVVLSDGAGIASRPQVENGQITSPSVVVNKPDFVVQSPGVSKGTLSPGESFTLSATVRNSGSGGAAGTTLRYYRSTDSAISRSDTQVGIGAVISLNSNSAYVTVLTLNAPTAPGTYYYGACVDAVSNEADTNNNCSTAVSVTVQSTGQTVNIRDANLRAKIEAALGKASGATITTADMARLTELEAQNANISDLTGLEHATNLTWLYLGSNNISDISALSGLTNLTELLLYDNSISDISALSGLTNLTRLDLDNNSISDISALSGMTNLTGLELESNSISDISALSGLTNLTRLGLWGNSISDISALSGLTNLTSLELGNNSISDLSALSGLTNLTWLGLWNNTISDISALSGLTNLTGLELSGNSISDISALSGLTNLTQLYLGSNSSIVDISALSGLTNLTKLGLWANNISDLSPLVSNAGLGSGDEVNVKRNPLNAVSINTHIPTLQRRGVTVEYDIPRSINIPDANLRAAIETELGKASGATITTADMATLTGLGAGDPNMSDLTGLEHAINLTFLFLDNSSISDISVLSGLTNLTSLYLNSNILSDISAVSGLTNLRELRLAYNSISDISALSGLTNLTRLRLDDNSISDISALSGLTNLTDLWLENNTITDLSPLVSNTGLGDGDSVDARGNPLNAESINTHIPTLQGRGVVVDFPALPQTVNIPDANLRAAIESALGKASGDTITTADMATLTELNANNANISTLTGLEHATKLTSLHLDEELVQGDWTNSNSISDISVLSGLTNLTYLYLSGNSISDISALSGLTNLTYLKLHDNAISDISALSGLTNLTGLWLFDNSISDISVLSGLTNLTSLSLPENNIVDISALAGLTNLEGLILWDNSISDISVLSGLTNLEHLSLSRNSISDISVLSGLTNLEHLSLSRNSISDISALSGLTNLTYLGLDNNSISDISALSGLTNLTQLWLQNNTITSISALSGLTNLTELRLRNNNITDLSPLVSNAGLGSGDEVDAMGNPLNAESINTHIPTLQGRGVEVYFDAVVEQTVNIPDANLRAAIESTLGKASGDTITTADMARLTELDAKNANISTLTGLEHATKLTSLDLGGHLVQGRLTNSNTISDISALSGLTNLTRLRLQGNALSDISALSGLTNLESLSLWSNSISDISALAGLTNLTGLFLWDNAISDISALSGLTNLTGLNLGNNSISDISALSGLTNLENLFLRRNTISDISALSGLTNLTRLYLWSNSISNISALSGLINLTELYLGNNTISDISSLSGLTNLTELLLYDNSISDLSALSGLTNLTELHLSDNALSDISALSGLTNLTHLWLQDNNIVDISALSGLTNLTRLYLVSNSISDISALSGLTNLTYLNLGNNSISDISALSGLTNLTYLLLENNTISDLSPLVSNTGLGSGDTVNVKGNPLNAVSINTHIPTLQRRGVEVHFDDVAVQTVNIPDANLRAAIENALGKASGATITTADMATLTRLDAPNAGIRTLTGLEHAINLTELDLGDGETVQGGWTNSNSISDISALSGLTNLTYLLLENNTISDISALSGLTNLEFLYLWSNSISDISALSGLTNLIQLLLENNTITDLSPLVSNTGLRSGDEVNVRGNPLNAESINTHIPTLQRRGVVVNFPALPQTVSVFPSPVNSPAVGDQFTLSLRIANGTKVTGYQASVQFDASALRYVGSANGDYLPAGAFFVPPIADGNSVTLAGTSLAGESAQNTGTLATITFSVIAVKASTVHLSDVLLTDSLGGSSSPQVQAAEITESPQLPEDVNQDGVVNILDLTLVASNFGKTGQNNADVNGDSVVNIIDLTLVAAAFGQTAAAPGIWSLNLDTMPTRTQVAAWLREARQMNLTDSAFQRGFTVLEQLLAALPPEETALLPNYPNPFNPETWIPYRLATGASVSVRIYDQTGRAIRTIRLGHRHAAAYENRTEAIYWDGRNEFGEPVASGVYFYTLTAGDYAATRKMLVGK